MQLGWPQLGASSWTSEPESPSKLQVAMLAEQSDAQGLVGTPQPDSVLTHQGLPPRRGHSTGSCHLSLRGTERQRSDCTQERTEGWRGCRALGLGTPGPTPCTGGSSALQWDLNPHFLRDSGSTLKFAESSWAKISASASLVPGVPLGPQECGWARPGERWRLDGKL
jgi:hypothetical protein